MPEEVKAAIDESLAKLKKEYDIEVVVAAISIVKYLITSKQFIFDANLLRQFTDIPYTE